MVMEPESKKICAVTGASGYVGGRIAHHIAAAGWGVVRLGRHAGEGSVTFRLGEPVSPETLRGCQALVHCAYDFSPLAWSDIEEINVRGTARLFETAREAGVHRIVLISTISAFEGCRSLYGQAKLAMERLGAEFGACVIRPGLVHGADAGGMFGRLASQARGGGFIPVPGSGKELQYLVHHEDLAAAVLSGIEKSGAPKVPVTVAHERPWPLREIILTLGRAYHQRPLLVPVPWRLVWMGLKSAELAGVPIGVRSDSLISLIFQDPSPNLNVQGELGVDCRGFDANACVPRDAYST